MELTIKLRPDQQSIHMIDEVMNTYTTLYDLPYKREICFVAHELVINSVDAMKKAEKIEEIEFHVTSCSEKIEITVIDYAGGIPKEKLNTVLDFNIDDLISSERGRGLFFVKNMVDEITFHQPTEMKFLVKVLKKL